MDTCIRARAVCAVRVMRMDTWIREQILAVQVTAYVDDAPVEFQR